MAKNFCPICGTALVPGLDACPNCGRRIEPDEPDRMAEPPQVQAQDGTRDAGQSGQESGGAPAADFGYTAEEREAERRSQIRAAIDACQDCDPWGRLDDLSACPQHLNFRVIAMSA